MKLKETAQILSNVGLNLGVIADETFYYSLKDNLKLGNITFDSIQTNVKGNSKTIQDEFDIVMYNGNCIALIEIKHKVHPNDLDNLIEKRAKNFKYRFPQFEKYKIYLGIGGLSIAKDVVDKAHEKVVDILRQKGEIVKVEDKYLVAY